MNWYHRLETLDLHVDSKGVWDGDQISKGVRDDLVSRGWLFRLEGHSFPTKLGFVAWALTLWLYWLLRGYYQVKWYVQGT